MASMALVPLAELGDHLIDSGRGLGQRRGSSAALSWVASASASSWTAAPAAPRSSSTAAGRHALRHLADLLRRDSVASLIRPVVSAMRAAVAVRLPGRAIRLPRSSRPMRPAASATAAAASFTCLAASLRWPAGFGDMAGCPRDAPGRLGDFRRSLRKQRRGRDGLCCCCRSARRAAPPRCRRRDRARPSSRRGCAVIAAGSGRVVGVFRSLRQPAQLGRCAISSALDIGNRRSMRAAAVPTAASSSDAKEAISIPPAAMPQRSPLSGSPPRPARGAASPRPRFRDRVRPPPARGAGPCPARPH